MAWSFAKWATGLRPLVRHPLPLGALLPFLPATGGAFFQTVTDFGEGLGGPGSRAGWRPGRVLRGDGVGGRGSAAGPSRTGWPVGRQGRRDSQKSCSPWPFRQFRSACHPPFRGRQPWQGAGPATQQTLTPKSVTVSIFPDPAQTSSPSVASAAFVPAGDSALSGQIACHPKNQVRNYRKCLENGVSGISAPGLSVILCGLGTPSSSEPLTPRWFGCWGCSRGPS